MVLCDRNISELRDILNRKAPKVLPDAEVLLAEMSYELIPAVDYAEKLIRDAKDQPILNAAIISDVDVILTGDKDFLSLDLEHPRCMTAVQFLKKKAQRAELCAFTVFVITCIHSEYLHTQTAGLILLSVQWDPAILFSDRFAKIQLDAGSGCPSLSTVLVRTRSASNIFPVRWEYSFLLWIRPFLSNSCASFLSLAALGFPETYFSSRDKNDTPG